MILLPSKTLENVTDEGSDKINVSSIPMAFLEGV
jgi:hypothetical protein